MASILFGFQSGCDCLLATLNAEKPKTRTPFAAVAQKAGFSGPLGTFVLPAADGGFETL